MRHFPAPLSAEQTNADIDIWRLHRAAWGQGFATEGAAPGIAP
jgi:RimJ/RimL family protein N-acetyltransferase